MIHMIMDAISHERQDVTRMIVHHPKYKDFSFEKIKWKWSERDDEEDEEDARSDDEFDDPDARWSVYMSKMTFDSEDCVTAFKEMADDPR